MKSMKDVLMFGIQGSGKGTQAKLLAEHFKGHYNYFEPGNIFRALKTSENSLGDYVQKRIDHGLLIEDPFTIQIFKTYTTTLEPNHYMLIDGFPRKMHQMHAFCEYMLDNKRDFVAIFLDLDEEKAIQRLMLRGRSDDVPNAIRQRIDQYLAETMPVVNYFKSIDKLITVNGDNSVQQVWEEMIEKVHENFK